MEDYQSEQTAGGVIKSISPALGMVPYVGPILSMAGGFVGGLLEQDAAKKQQRQAENARKTALGLKPDQLNQEFTQALNATKMAELSGLPGIDLWKSQLDAQTANNIRAIRESSKDGASTLAAISAAVGNQSENMNQLAMADMQYRAERGLDVRKMLWGTGIQKRGLEDRRDQWKREGLQAAAALESAATYNKINAANKMIGSVTSTVSALAGNAGADNKDAMWASYMNSLLTPQASTTTQPASGYGQFTEYQSGATLPINNNMFAPINYPYQIGQ